jgi:hypothetical protein
MPRVIQPSCRRRPLGWSCSRTARGCAYERAAASRQLEGLRERSPYLVAVEDLLVAQCILEHEDGEPDLGEQGGEARGESAELIEVGAERQMKASRFSWSASSAGEAGRRRRLATAAADEPSFADRRSLDM